MSSNYAGVSPKNPSSYTGPVLAYPSVVLRSRRPTGADFRQPENGKLYPTSSYWIIGANPLNGIQGELWYLSKITANVAYWIMVSGGVTPPVLSFQVQQATAPGVNPVVPDAGGLMSINGAVVAAHSVPLETRTRAINAYNIELQVASLVSPTPANTNSAGVACYNTNQFQLDATSGMVSLKGSTTLPPILTETGDTGGAIGPNGSGNLSHLGGGAATGIVTAGSANQINYNVYRWVAPTTWPAVVIGSVTPGTGTYIRQNAIYSRVGNMIFFTFDLQWSAHTGSGNILVSGFPKAFAYANTDYPYAVIIQNITLPANTIQVMFNGQNGVTQGAIVAVRDATTITPVVLGGSGAISCYGFYFSDVA